MAQGSPSLIGKSGAWDRLQDVILPIGIILSVLVILVPLPASLMDILLSLNITISVIMVLTTISVRTPLEFNIFPTLLLATTLGRLVLNVATTRLILSSDTAGTGAAGGVIEAFSAFVAGDRIIVGLIIFVIIIVIQFVVITKGSTRISEVAARFALDGMPGRQMAIDADLNAGIIDEQEAQKRRDEVTAQADFYGSMDGASKFVRGDAIAGIIITLINVIGGFVIGVFELGLPLTEAFNVYTRLTIGDGLVSQIPAFLVSLAAGLLVTRSSKESNLGGDVIKQLFSNSQALMIAAGFLAILSFTNLPRMPLFVIGGSCAVLGMIMKPKPSTEEEQEANREASEAERAEAAQKKESRIEDYLQIDPMELEIGIGIIRLADPKRGGDLLERVTKVRQNVAADIGIILPKVRIRDNVSLSEKQYQIKISDIPVAEGEVFPNLLLAMDSGMTTGKIEGIETKEPAFNMPAVWIEPNQRERAELLGYTVVEPGSVLATHLTEVIRKHADELLTRDATKDLLEQLKQNSPAAVEELVPDLLKLGEVQRVLQGLLREGVPIRNLSSILEALGDYASKIKDTDLLVEYARHRIARQICSRYRDQENTLHVITLDPALEDKIAAGTEFGERGLTIRLSPQVTSTIVEAIATEVEKLSFAGHPQLLLVGPQIRPALKQITCSTLPRLVVMSFNEVTRDTKVNALGIVTDLASGQTKAQAA